MTKTVFINFPNQFGSRALCVDQYSRALLSGTIFLHLLLISEISD